MQAQTKLPDLTAVVVEHAELKLIGIPCISLSNMSQKYHNAKEGLLSAAKHLPNIKDPQVHYGVWPQVESQNNPETHAYLLCVEVESFEGTPEWFLRLTLPPQRCVAVASYDGNFDAAGSVIDRYVSEQGLAVSAGERRYTIVERYRYEAEGFSRYSLPIV